MTLSTRWRIRADQTQEQLTSVLKNVALAGGALAFAALASQELAESSGVALL